MGNPVSKSQEFMEQRERSNTEHRKQGSLAMNLVREEFNRDIQEVYDLRSGELLGKGGFGTVRVVTHKETQNKYALKTIELKDVETHEQYEFLLNEIEIMKQLDHPNIARVQEVFHTPDHYYMVMDLYTGGDMYARYKFRSEDDTAKIVNKLINALRYCHDKNVAHRDIKLENICFESEADDAEVKLVDFGLSASFKDEQLRHDLVGSWAFMAPEVLQRAHHPQACDLWSMGVITYCLLAGFPPFRSVNLKGLKEQILYSKVSFEEDVWRNVSHTAKDFILKLLRKDPKKRLTAQQAQQHPWLSSRARSNGGVNAKLSPKVVENLMHFKSLNLMKRVALGVVARTLEASEMRNLEQEFHKADITKSGVISIEDFRAILLRSNQFQRKEVDEIFDGLDVWSSGQLSYTDFTAAALDRQTLDKRRLKYAFERLDHDNNGELDYEDLMMTVGSDLSTEDVRTAIKQFDPKGNGKVTFDDFCKGMRSAGGALDALSTAQLTSGYMVESIAKGEGEKAIQKLAKMEKITPKPLRVTGATAPHDSAERPPQVEGRIAGAATSGGAADTSASPALNHGISVTSSAGTAEMSRPHSFEQERGPPLAAVVRAPVGAVGGTGGDGSVGGGSEATAPVPRKSSKEVSPVGGGRADASSVSHGGWAEGENVGGEAMPVVTMELWGEGMRGSLADRRMRDSIRLRSSLGGALAVTAANGAGGAGFSLSPRQKSVISSSPLNVASRQTPSSSPQPAPSSGTSPPADAMLLPPLPHKAGTAGAGATARGARGGALGVEAASLATAQAEGRHLPAPASRPSGGEPAECNRSSPPKKSFEPAADLPPKDSTAGEADLGWGAEGLPADLAAMGDPPSVEVSIISATSSGNGTGGSRTPKSLRFGGVPDKKGGNGRRGGRRKSRPTLCGGVKGGGGSVGGGGGRRGLVDSTGSDVYRNFDSGSSEDGSALGRNRKRTGTFCFPGGASGNDVPFFIKWMDAIFRGKPG